MKVLASSPMQMSVSPVGHGMPEPEYPTVGAPAFVISSAVDATLRPMQPIRLPTGIAIGIPSGYGAQVLPDPSLAELGVLPAPEMYGADDRSPLAILLTWSPPLPLDGPRVGFGIGRGDVIARIAIVPVLRIKLVQVRALSSGPGAPLPTSLVPVE